MNRPGDLIAARFRVIRSLDADPSVWDPVYEVEDSRGQRHALKLYWGTYDRFIDFLAKREPLHHPNIIEVKEFGKTEEDRGWVLMELHEGETLAQALARAGRFDFDETTVRTLELVAALTAAERAHIYEPHFSLKHIFLARPDATAKLWDVGYSLWDREIMDPEYDPQYPDFRHTYYTQEMFRDAGPAHTAGQIALFSFHLLVGQQYWPIPDHYCGPWEAFKTIGQAKIVPPSQRAAELGSLATIPRGYDAWFLRCLGPPEARYADTQAAVDALVTCRARGG